MTAKERNFLATLCLNHVKYSDPTSFAIMRDLALENSKPDSPRYGSGFMYHKFLELRKEAKAR